MSAPIAEPTPAPTPAPVAFNWKKAIRKTLRGAPGGALRLKQLRQAVLTAHAALLTKLPHATAEAEDAPRRTFMKRLKKTRGVVVSGKLVQLDKAK